MYEPCMVIDIIADAARNCNPHFEMFSREDEKGFAIPGKICYNIPEHERNEVENVAQKISNSVLKRLPVYLSYLKSLPEDAPENISATTLAAALNMGEVQVRKDLALVSDAAAPRSAISALVWSRISSSSSGMIIRTMPCSSARASSAARFWATAAFRNTA